MKEIILICLGSCFIIVLGACLGIDYYRNKQHQVKNRDLHDNDASPNVTGALLFIYAFVALLLLGFIT